MDDNRKADRKSGRALQGVVAGKIAEKRTSVWVIGGGQMGGVMSRYLSRLSGSRVRVCVVDPRPEILEDLGRDGIVGALTLSDLLERSTPAPSFIVLAVKPGIYLNEESGLSKSLSGIPKRTLGVSLMAGVSLGALAQRAPGIRWIRSMTNLALSTGKGMTVLAAAMDVTTSERISVLEMFSGMGRALWIPEESFDSATAIVGSGPGLMALVAEALSDGGVREGLSRESATLLASWAMFGAGSLLAEVGISPELLKARVASPAGTTIEGLATLERFGVRGAFMEAVHSMTEKSANISKHV